MLDCAVARPAAVPVPTLHCWPALSRDWCIMTGTA
jgi:hypothetical protein